MNAWTTPVDNSSFAWSGRGVKGLSEKILLFILLNSAVMKPHKTTGHPEELSHECMVNVF